MRGRNVVLPPLSDGGSNGAPAPVVASTSPQRQMTLDVKARTLGYHLPHAEAEIQRIEELQRTRRDEFLKRRQERPTERSTHLTHWLERHEEASLQDLALAASPVPVRSIMMPTTTAATASLKPLEGMPVGALSNTKSSMEQLFAFEDAVAENSTTLDMDERAHSLHRSMSSGTGDRNVDSIGISRYQIRGDLKEWLSRVEGLNERLILDAGDFTAGEEAFLRSALEKHMSKAVHKDAARDEFLMKECLKSLCEMIENMTRTPFAIREDASVKAQLESLEKQVQDLYSKAMKRGGFIFGSQLTATDTVGTKKAESEGEIRKRQLAAGVAAAAQSQHILLTHVQLDQVLQAFYQQQKPSNKREQGRIERQLVQAMVREDNITTTLRRRNKELSEETEALQETIQQLMDERQRSRAQSQVSLVPTAISEGGGGPESLLQTNETIKEMSEVLARKAIREIQETCDTLRAHSNECSSKLAVLQTQLEEVTRERDDYRDRVHVLEDQWTKQEEAKKQQEEERRRLFGGMRSDQQYYQSTIHKLLLQSVTTFTAIVATVGDGDKGDAKEWASILSLLDEWTSAVSFSFHLCDSAKAQMGELRKSTAQRVNVATMHDLSSPPKEVMATRGGGSDGSANTVAATPPSHRQPSDSSNESVLNRQLINDLSQRLDDTIGEAKSKFREARFMRSFMWYLIHCFDAMLNGTYNDEVHGKRQFASVSAKGKKASAVTRHREAKGDGTEGTAASDAESFPPSSVVALDADYAYAWSEEIQALERVFMGFRSRLSTSESQQGEVNSAVLRALESVGDSMASQKGPGASTEQSQQQQLQPQTTHARGAVNFSSGDVKNTVDQIAGLPISSAKDVRLSQTLEDHQRLPSGARAVDVATVLLLQIKEAKGHFSGGKS